MEQTLTPLHATCWVCGGKLWVGYTTRRTVLTLDGVCRFTLRVRRCIAPACPRLRQPYRPEEEGHYVLPYGEVGLAVIALIGALRFAEHRSVPEIHQELHWRGVALAARTVTNLLYRYEELVALHLSDRARLRTRLHAQGRVILALDGVQPDVGHEVLWVLRDVLSGEVLLARSLLSGATEDLRALLQEVKQALPVPLAGVVSDGQHPIRRAVAAALPGVPHQLCHFHYLRDAALPLYEADRQAKKELKKRIRGVRPSERSLEGRQGPEAVVARGYCLAVRSALTDDGRPPLDAAGLRLRDRLEAIDASLVRVGQRGLSRRPWRASTVCWPTGWPQPRPRGRTSALRMRGSIARRTCSRTRRMGTR
jgi:hypothetical protein